MKNTKTQITAARVKRAIQFRFNPLSQLSPEYLVSCHNSFKAGWLRPAALLWNEIEDTDDILMSVAPKRKKAVSRHGYEITTVDDSRRAKQHADTLKQFYDNVSATSALDLNEGGGMPLLIRQMMDAVGKRYAVHEIVWQYRGFLTAQFKHVPLQFFENRTGRLRYLSSDTAMEGDDLQPGAWMTTTGDGIMRACSTAYMFKHLALSDWLIFCEKYGFPIIIGKSEGQPGSDEWDSMEAAVADAAGGDSIVASLNADIEALGLNNSGELPWPAMIDRMDRSLSVLWRGGDLSTMSAGNAVGASLQGDETDILEEDDAQNITDVLQEQVDRWVIKYAHGDTTPLAWVKIKTAQRQDAAIDLETDKGLSEMGYTDTLAAIRERYNRPALEKQTPNHQPPTTNQHPTSNEAVESLAASAREAIALAVAKDVQPAAHRLVEILENTPDAALLSALQTFQTDELPALAAEALNDPASENEFLTLYAAAAEKGYTHE